MIVTSAVSGPPVTTVHLLLKALRVQKDLQESSVLQKLKV